MITFTWFAPSAAPLVWWHVAGWYAAVAWGAFILGLFGVGGGAEAAMAKRNGVAGYGTLNCTKPTPKHMCAALMKAKGIPAASQAKLAAFEKATAAAPLADTMAHVLAELAISYNAGFEARCAGLNNKSISQGGRDYSAQEAGLVSMLSTASSLYAGLVNNIENACKVSADPLAAQLRKLWGPGGRAVE